MAIEGFRQKYLERLGLDPSAEWPLTAETLGIIQEAHQSTVPFEIIDSMTGTHIELDAEALFQKLIIRRRGGFCYEVNQLLALFLEDLGFTVERLAGWVPSCKGRFDHFFLRVMAEGEPWMVDVGFRNGSLLPLRFEEGLVQDGVKADYRIDAATAEEAGTDGFGDQSFWLMRKPKGTDEWLKAFRYDMTVFQLEDYVERCVDFAEGGWSPFQRRPSCSLETRNGEVYLNDAIFVDVVDGQLVQRGVTGPTDFTQTLVRRFGVLPDGGDMIHAVTSDDVPMHVHEVVALEKQIAANGFPMVELMERAGAAVATTVAGLAEMQVVKPWDDTAGYPLITVMVGNGNNGGDGWVIADILHQNGYNVMLVTEKGATGVNAQPAAAVANEIMVSVTSTLAHNARALYRGVAPARVLNIEMGPSEERLAELLKKSAVIVDALLGTGFKKDKVRKPFNSWIDLMNEAHDAGVPVIAVDVPSGMNAQTGAVAKNCVKADATITMLRAKKAMLAEDIAEYVGHLFIASLED